MAVAVGFSGRKQSGKDTSARFLIHNANYLFGYNQFDFKNVAVKPARLFVAPVKSEVHAVRYGFGDPMKEFAATFLGIDRKLLWGTNDDKEKLTGFRWENLSHYHQPAFIHHHAVHSPGGHRPVGEMTVRQVLQEIGESMFLDLYPRIWTDYIERKVAIDKPDVITFSDPRKPEQITCMKNMGAAVIRLTRNPLGNDDVHISETALDIENYDWTNFDLVLMNDDMTVKQQNRAVAEFLNERNLLSADCDLTDIRIDWNPAE